MAGPQPRIRLSHGYALLIVWLRWLILPAVAAGVVASTMFLPPMEDAGDGGLRVAPKDSAVLRGQRHVLELFGLPLLSQVVLVQADERGLSNDILERTFRQAAQVNINTAQHGVPEIGIAGALPVPNSVMRQGQPTTIVTYLLGGTSLNAGELVQAAQDYGNQLGPQAAVVGVTGVAAVQQEQGRLVLARLHWVELGSVAAVALIVGLAFGSVLAPVITLASALGAYLITMRIIGAAAAQLQIPAPSQLHPVIVALTLGVTTDYSIFFLSGMRSRVRRGMPARDALVSAVTHNLPIVLVAGITVTAGVATLSVAQLPLFRVFGPGLAITVAVGLLVSITLVPAALATFGRWALWPGTPPAGQHMVARTVSFGERFARVLTLRPVAAVVVVLCLAALLAAAWPLLTARASVASAESLPDGNPVRVAAAAAAKGFAPGVLAPTEVVVERPEITGSRAALVELQRELSAQPKVAVVFGPAQQPIVPPDQQVGLFLAPGGDAARYLVVFDDDPLSAAGLRDLQNLQAAMPTLLQRASLADAKVDYVGAGALGGALVSAARGDLLRVAIVAGLVNLALLMLFLRAVVAPLYLLCCSFLSVGAALGLTTLLFQHVIGYVGLIFYAPFAAAVLLISLGSDYNIFTVGRIWDEARTRPLRQALALTLPRSARPINVAGLTLAASFGCVALIPVAPFRELAFAVAVGVLLDTFLVRSLLVPALIVLVGRVSGWPGRRLAAAQESGAAVPGAMYRRRDVD
jgi:RND superfamily putative drug exporter